MKIMKLLLVTENSSWWKQVKIRKQSSETLKHYKKLGWRLKSKKRMSYPSAQINTNTVCKYILYKN